MDIIVTRAGEENVTLTDRNPAEFVMGSRRHGGGVVENRSDDQLRGLDPALGFEGAGVDDQNFFVPLQLVSNLV